MVIKKNKTADLRSLTLKQLRALTETASRGSVTAAARSLHVTPPAITIQLKLIEDCVALPLLDRSADGFLPTPAGRVLLEAAEAVDIALTRARESIEALRSGAAGAIAFAAVSTAKYFAPAIVAEFVARHPSIRVKLVIGNRSEIVAGLERGAYDILLMGRPPDHVPIVSTPLGDHPHIVIAAARHRLAGARSLLVRDLVRERFLAREIGSGTRLLMERLLGRGGTGHAIDIIEMGTNETIKQAVMAGLGIAMISAHTCLAELADGRLVALDVRGFPVVRQWFLLHRADRSLSPAAALLQQFLLDRSSALVPRYVQQPAGRRPRTRKTASRR